MAVHDHKRSCGVVATTIASLALALAAAPATLAAGSGGASASGGAAASGSTSSGTSGGSTSGGTSASGGTTSTKSGTTSTKSGDTSAKTSTPEAAPAITTAHCEPTASCSANDLEVSLQDGQLELTGKGIGADMGVTFASRRNGKALGPTASDAPRAHLRKTKQGLLVTVPQLARTGRIAVVIAGTHHTNLYGPIVITAKKLHPPVKIKSTKIGSSPTGTAFDGQGMWIWYVSKSNGGNVESIIDQAKAAGVTTLYVKSSDGTNWWTQFSPELVAEIHAAGLKLCAWQYVYGTDPTVEAELGARAAATGAECLVIDAESEYEGRYSAAQEYIAALRAKVGASYPVGLASFPYVQDHEAFPYSVFLGPEGAQFDVPQMYWKDIGTSVADVYATTYEQNLVYGREIEPLGQTFEAPSASELVAFRSLAGDYGASGLSFWDWQETSAKGWEALAAPLDTELAVPSPEDTAPLLAKGAAGDQVLWMQEHLATAIPGQPITGIFEATTVANLEAFQTSKGLPATGKTDASTWGYLLDLAPVAVDWTGTSPKA